MKAVRYAEHGDASVLRYEDVEVPEPSEGRVLVRVAATSYNPLDGGIRAGYLREVFPVRLPHTPGIDVAGTVTQLGAGVDGFAAGQTVIGLLPLTEPGAAAEFVAAPADVLTAAPTSIPLADAAALPGAGLSAWQALFELAELRAGQRILVVGAGGGVGGFAVQLAKRAGAHVIATASSRSAAAVRAAGADEVVDYTATSLNAAVTDAVDVVLSLVTVGDEEMASFVELIRPGGVIVTTGSASRGDPDRDVQARSLFVRNDAEQLGDLVALIDSGELRVDVSERCPLPTLRHVHERGSTGDLRGKVVITVEDDGAE